ncbi:MAG: DUF1848 family protein [Candidatus Aminicenantes bacterium]|nr:DUF1848 family protein [Candidatus Aminicenantes bacterium]
MIKPAIISASRRTDIPAFYLRWLVEGIKKEEVTVRGPYGRMYRVNLSPERVHTLVLWSKNFLPLLKNAYGSIEALKKYSQIYFLFTITGLGGTKWEINVPSPEKTIRQLEPLSEIAGPERIGLRFDPVVHWKEGDKTKSNLQFFERLAPVLSSIGIKRVIFSFVQWYPRAVKRTRNAGIEFYDPPAEEKRREASYLLDIAKTYHLSLEACSQPESFLIKGIKKGACINAELLSSLHPFGWTISPGKDAGQRALCGCSKSIDIGSYSLPCGHICLYCYANPKLRIH